MEHSGAALPQRDATNTVGAYEAKTHLPQLLERVSRGERITITRHGVPVAMLVPAAAREQPDVRAAVEAMKRFRKGRSLKGLTIREMIEEGRRF
jgi:prevent-host-death family protein